MTAARPRLSEDGAWFAAAGATPDLFEAALRLGRCDHPGIDLAPYREHLAELARDAEAAGAATATGRLEALVSILSHRHGYTGDAKSYDDLANANLIDVIDRRRGSCSGSWRRAEPVFGATAKSLDAPWQTMRTECIVHTTCPHFCKTVAVAEIPRLQCMFEGRTNRGE